MSRGPIGLNQAVLRQSTNARNGDTLNGVTGTGAGVGRTTLLFLNVNAVTTTAIAVNSTNDGTTIEISEAGIYDLDFTLVFSGAVAILAGIQVGGVVDSSDPVLGANGVIKTVDVVGVAALTMQVEVATHFYVTAAQAATPLEVRMRASNSANAAPFGLVVANCNYRIAQLASLPF